MDCEYIYTSIYVLTLVGESIFVNKVYRICRVMFMEFMTLAGLVILDSKECDVILGMSWLSH